MTDKVLGFNKKDAIQIAKGIREYDTIDDAVEWLKCHTFPVVSLEWLEKHIKKMKDRHWEEMEIVGEPSCDCSIEGSGYEDICEVIEELNSLLSAAKKEAKE